MIGVDKIEDIRRRARRGEPIAAIARAVGVSEPTARKYARMDDLSPEPPRRRKPESEVLAPYEGTIDSWLDDDCRNWRKQRHTAVRVYVRLRDELGYDGSYSTVQRYVRRRREEMARERDRRDAEGFLTLSWLPGEVQVDFGEADFRVRGVVTRGKYLTVTFPHSNVGLTQVFWGETSECVCQGLRNVFEFIGGVPRRAVFDNATEVGRRVGGEVRVSELFRRFAAHYGLDYTFTNPYSGNEKGNVENKVGCHRRNLFVPVPSFHDVAAFNRRLLGDCLDLSAGKRHYRLGTPELELFGEDKDALSPLPPAAFSCVKWETRTCNKQGTFTVGGPHRYSAGPAYARRRVDVALGAFDVTVCDASTGEAIATYEREWGEAPTDSSDPTLQLRLLCARPAGWRDSSVRASLPAELVSFLDAEPPADLAADLRVLRDESAERGWPAAVEGMSRSLAATGGIDRASVALSAARAAAGDERVEYDEEVDLGVYDGGAEAARRGWVACRRRARSVRQPRRPSATPPGRYSYRATPSPPSSPPRRQGRWRRARRCSSRRSRTATGRRGRGCCGRRGSPCPRRSTGSTGRTWPSQTAGAARTCAPWRSCATPRTSCSTARRGAGRPTWPPRSESLRRPRATL
jgi:transposase